MLTEAQKSCCTIPPVEADYTPKGAFETIEGLKTYVTGPEDATKLIIYAYDIFGQSPQALQGADLLAAGTRARVCVPDFFDGKLPDRALFKQPRTPEAEAQLKEFRATTASAERNLATLDKLITLAKSQGIERVGAIGFCWGAKIVILSSLTDAKAVLHPSNLASTDGDNIGVPTALWPTSGEDMTIMNAINETLKTKPFASKNVFYHYSEEFHGFAGARCDTSNPRDAAAFHGAFVEAARFFSNVL